MVGSKERKEANAGLVRVLGQFDTTMMIVGIVIGSGIFLTSGIMAQYLPSAWLILLAWLVGGLLALAGALTMAELGVAMPQAGGQYVYLREAYGPLSGFLFGWVFFIVYQTAAMAAIGAAFAEYFGHFIPSLSTKTVIFSSQVQIINFNLPYSLSMGQLVSVVLIIVLSAFNYLGVVYGKAIQNIFTVVKIGTLVVFIILGVTMGKKISIDFTVNPAGLDLGQLTAGFGLALIAASWAYNGWNYINFVGEEIKNPARTLPRSLLYGTLGITLLYILINYVYLLALPVDKMAGVVAVAEKASAALFGSTASGLISAAVVISTFGGLNGTIFAGARVFFAMARDKLFFKKMAQVHPRYRTPAFAIVVQAVWACLYALSGTFEQLITLALVVTLMFWIAAAASVFTLRKKFPHLPRPYKTWGYPIVPILFILASAGILVNTFLEKTVESMIGIALTVLGIPVYYCWKSRYTSVSP